jgi:hypothetical protein
MCDLLWLMSYSSSLNLNFWFQTLSSKGSLRIFAIIGMLDGNVSSWLNHFLALQEQHRPIKPLRQWLKLLALQRKTGLSIGNYTSSFDITGTWIIIPPEPEDPTKFLFSGLPPVQIYAKLIADLKKSKSYYSSKKDNDYVLRIIDEVEKRSSFIFYFR